MATPMQPSSRHLTTYLAHGSSTTVAGADYLTKALHPPSELPQGYAGMPDQTGGTLLCQEYRLLDKCSPEKGSALFLLTPGMCYPVFQGPRYDDRNEWQAAINLGTNNRRRGQWNTYLQPNPITAVNPMDHRWYDLSRNRQTYRSTTFYLNTNDLANKGVVACARFRPPVHVAYPREVRGEFSLNLPPELSRFKIVNLAEFESIAREHYIRRNEINKLIKAGTENRAKLGLPEPRLVTDLVIQVVQLGAFINSTSQVLSISPKSKAWLAKEGAYVRTFNSQPAEFYKSTSYRLSGSRPESLPLSAYMFTNNNDEWYLNFFTGKWDGDINDPSTAAQDFEWSDREWAYVFFEGLDDQANIEVKTIMGFESTPIMGSPLLPSCTLAPAYDDLALKSLYNITCIVPDALEAKYNTNGPNEAAKVEVADVTPDEAANALANMNIAAVEKLKPPPVAPRKTGRPTNGTQGRPDIEDIKDLGNGTIADNKDSIVTHKRRRSVRSNRRPNTIRNRSHHEGAVTIINNRGARPRSTRQRSSSRARSVISDKRRKQNVKFSLNSAKKEIDNAKKKL